VLETAVRDRPKDPATHFLLGLHLVQPPKAHAETIVGRSFDAEKSFGSDSEATVDFVKCFRRAYLLLLEEVKCGEKGEGGETKKGMQRVRREKLFLP
jgi:hypothetical protein